MTQQETNTPDQSQNEQSCQGIEQAILRFEKIMMSRIYVQQRLGDRLKLSIRTGMLVLFLLAIAMLILIVTLSVQVSRVADVADNMNKNFYAIAKNMQTINKHMHSMEKQVVFIPKIKDKTAIMDAEIHLMNNNLSSIKGEVKLMTKNLIKVQKKMLSISNSVVQMDNQVGQMSNQVHRLSKPATSINKIFPF